MLAILRGIITLVLLGLNLLFWALPLHAVALVKLVTPVQRARLALSRTLVWIASSWIGGTIAVLRLTQSISWDVEGLEGLERDDWYLVLCNHASWVDIIVLLWQFHGRMPFPKFFLKRELIRIPILGFAWWALDFPFMHRHSKEHLARHPEAKRTDLEATRRACEHFRHTPTAIINYVEGTRNTPEKHARQASPYSHLLKPRAGGTAFVLGAMGDILQRIVDATIVYPGGAVSFWDMCCGRLGHVVLRVRLRDIPDWVIAGDYETDRAFRARFQGWLNELWREKDETIEAILAPSSTDREAA